MSSIVHINVFQNTAFDSLLSNPLTVMCLKKFSTEYIPFPPQKNRKLQEVFSKKSCRPFLFKVEHLSG
jgi:hypothetical protein